MKKYWNALLSLLQKNFLAGLLVLIPLMVSLWVFRFVISFLLIFSKWVPGLQNTSELPFWLRGLTFIGTIVVTMILISLLGLISRNYIGERLLKELKRVIKKVPVLGAVYSTLDQLLRTMMPQGGGQQFNRVVWIEYPRKGIWTVGFVTGPVQVPTMPPGYLNVFVPAVPNPTSGFHMVVHESEVKEANLRVDEAFKMILSLGIAQPKDSP